MRDGQAPLPLAHLNFPPRREPAEAALSPLLLLLHGVASHEGDLAPLVPALDDRFHILSLRAPNSLGPSSYAWFEVRFTGHTPEIQPSQAEASRRLLIEFIRLAPRHYAVDRREVYLLGFSQGALMALALSLTQPDLLAGTVALSGRILPELYATEGPLAGHLASADDLEGLPIFLGHGTQDRVLPIHFGRSAWDRLASLPVALTYREYDTGHAISDTCLSEVGGWLSARLDGASHPVR